MEKYDDKQQREIFHFLFLERLLKISDPNLYVLKGGVNLRFFYRSPRYSEDLDIDVFGGQVDTLRKNIYKILQDASFQRNLRTYGIEELRINDPAKAKHTETTQRFKLRLVNEAGEEFPTKVEFSRRSRDKKNFVQELILPDLARNYHRLSYFCLHYPPENAALQKVLALGGRVETQARDVFDLYILLLGGFIKQEDLRKRVSSGDREKALLALMTLDYDAFRGQVVEYFESSSKDQFADKRVWERLCETVREMLE